DVVNVEAEARAGTGGGPLEYLQVAIGVASERASRTHSPYFPSWRNTFSIGSMEIRMSQPNGRSSSRIRKRAPATHKAEAIKAKLAVAFGGAIKLKSRKIITNQRTTTASIGLEMDVGDSASMSDRNWAISRVRFAAWALSVRSVSLCASRFRRAT